MFAHIDKRRMLGGGGFATKSGRRQLYAAIAILGLYIQLMAGSLCMGGALPDSLGFPICHTDIGSSASNDARSNPSDHAPAPQHSCPFCAIHCHAAIAVTPAIDGVENRVASATPVKAAPVVLFSAARFSAGTPARGPPASA